MQRVNFRSLAGVTVERARLPTPVSALVGSRQLVRPAFRQRWLRATLLAIRTPTWLAPTDRSRNRATRSGGKGGALVPLDEEHDEPPDDVPLDARVVANEGTLRLGQVFA